MVCITEVYVVNLHVLHSRKAFDLRGVEKKAALWVILNRHF